MAIPAIDLATIAAGNGGFVVHGQEANDQLGLSAVSAGDINGDGLDDLIMGARLADAAGNAKTNAGGTYVLFGKSDGFAAAIDAATLAIGMGGFVIHGEDAGDLSGQPVAAAGDVNGDGLDDVIIGAAEADGPGNARNLAGDSFVLFGRSSGLGAAVDLAAIGTQGFALNGPGAGDLSGSAVAGAGDVNGDGIADLIIGAPEGDAIGDGKASAGDTYIVFGRVGGFSGPLDLAGIASGNSTEGIYIPGAYASIRSGQAVAHAGDLNADGLDDIIIGAPGLYAPSGSGTGAAYIVYGTQGGVIDLAHVALGSGGFAITQKNWTETRFGFSVNSAGDLNADGYADLVMGNYWGGPPAHVVLGRAGGFGFGTPIELDQTKPTPGNFAILVQEANDRAGMSVASAGDVNGDGFDDLVIGAPGGDAAGNRKFDSGEAYVVFGHAGGFGANIRLSDIAAGIGGFAIYGQDPGDSAGRSVASAGDINGDGFDDLIIGAHGADGPNNMKPDAGSSYVVFGRNFTAAVTHLGAETAEALIGTDGDDVMIGGHGNDTLFGGRGNDVLKGGAGDDVLRIADFADRRLEGDRGDDTLALDGTDLTLDLSLIADTLLTGIEAIDVTGSGANTLRLTQREVLNLSDTSNMLRVIANADDTLDLADGGWTDGGLHGATRSFTQGNATVVLTIVPYESTPPGVLIVGDAGPNALNGGGGNDTLRGEQGNDVLEGGPGDDRLLGGEGADTLNGGAGADVLVGGDGDDFYRVDDPLDVAIEGAGRGADTVSGAVSFKLRANMEAGMLEGSDALALRGNSGDDRLLGNVGDNFVIGYGGADSLIGGLGDDTMLSGLGTDTLDGGGGRDLLIGNEDADLFLFSAVPPSVGEADIIIDFAIGVDRIGILGTAFDTSLAPGALDPSRFLANLNGQAATPGLGAFVFETDNGRLWWDADGAGGAARDLVAILRGGVVLGAGDIQVI